MKISWYKDNKSPENSEGIGELDALKYPKIEKESDFANERDDRIF